MTKFEKYMNDMKTGTTAQSPQPSTTAMVSLDSSPILPAKTENTATISTSASNPSSPLKGKTLGNGKVEEEGVGEDETKATRSKSTSRLGVYQKLSTVPFEPIQIEGRGENWKGNGQLNLATNATASHTTVSERLTEAFQKAVPSVNVAAGGYGEGEGDGESARGSRGSRRKSRERAAIEQQASVAAVPQQERPSPPKPKKSKVRVVTSKRTQESIEEEEMIRTMQKMKEDSRRRAHFQNQERIAQERAENEGEENYENYNKGLQTDFEILIREGAEELRKEKEAAERLIQGGVKASAQHKVRGKLEHKYVERNSHLPTPK
jgi:hypothetical protein